MRGAILGVAVACLLVLAAEVSAIGQAPYVGSTLSPGSFPIVQPEGTATLYVDSQDWPGVIRVVNDLQADIGAVTGRRAAISNDAGSLKGNVIIVGTIGKSRIIDDLAKGGKIDTRQTAGKWESFFIQVVPDALPNGAAALVIAGSDKRGTIYGVYDLSEQMGVSPWYWWADVPVRHRDAVYVKTGRYEQGEPSIKYRGIFLNDEAPDLSGWIAEKFGIVPRRENPPIPANVANYNSAFYTRIFEVILRLKANYLWPAMWNNAFNEDDPNSPRLADEYGVVMGTSHQEPMLRAQKEWDRRYQRTLGSWNYYKNPDVLQAFWREGIRRNKSYESIITLGLRGANDTPMIPGGTVAQSMALLEEIVAVQRKMIADEINPDVTKVPQLWCLYKEVQEYYSAGLRVPDDVTLLWAEDNWGDVRRLPTPQERQRSGGAGIYYHFDYVGGPRNYKWVNTNPIPKIQEQLTLAKEYGADRIWIVNVGHFKGLEFPIEFFCHLAWDTKRWTNRNIHEYTRLWASREFGPTHADAITDIISKYTKYNGRRKPELLEPTTYSLTSYQEADTVVADFKAITARAEQIHAKLPENARDAFYELVLFPAKACSQVNELYVAAGKNALYARQGRAGANDLAGQVEGLFKADADLMAYYNHTFVGGKWNHFMDQVHIGYTIWQDPPRNMMPRVTRIELPQASVMGVAVEGSALAWPGAPGDPCLPTFDVFSRQRHYIDIFSRGQTPFEYTATASEPWVMLSDAKGTIAKEERLWVSVDWTKAPRGSASGTVKIARAGGETVTIKVESFNPNEVTRESLDGFVEGEGYVSIEAEHCTKSVPAGQVRWEKIEDYGRTLSAMTILPVTAASVAPPQDSPCLEYKMYLLDPHSVKVLAIVAPTLNFVPDRALRYAVSFDDQPAQVIDIVPKGFDARNGNRDWEESVKNACRVVQSAHVLSGSGYHTLKIWMVDPGVVLQKIVVDLGGLKPNYLGPPESYRGTGAGGTMPAQLSFKLHYIDQDTAWVTSAMQMSLADLNSDGKLDWTVGNVYASPNFYWYEYQAPDRWVKHTILEGSAGETTAAVAVLDVNGDGNLDLISGRYLFLNRGKGASWEKFDIGTATPENQVHDHQAVDIDGDGKLDILSTNWWISGPSVGIYWYRAPTDPTEPWTSHKITSGVPVGYRAIHGATYPKAAGDFDEDGDTDVVGALGWFENKDAAGTQWEEHWNPAVFLGVDGTYQTAVRNAVCDLNGDGHLDIVQSECDTKTPVKIAWLKNDGHANFTRHVIREGFPEDYHSLVIADFDNDGDLDIFTGSGPLASGPTSHNMYLFENTAGAGHDPVYVMHNIADFLSAEDAARLTEAFSSDHCHEPMCGDVDGDGRMDLVVKGWDGRDVDGKPQKPAPFIYLENTTRR